VCQEGQSILPASKGTNKKPPGTTLVPAQEHESRKNSTCGKKRFLRDCLRDQGQRKKKAGGKNGRFGPAKNSYPNKNGGNAGHGGEI